MASDTNADGDQSQEVEGTQRLPQQQEPDQTPTSFKVAIIRMLPRDHATLYGTIVGLIILIACVCMGFIDYGNTHDLDHFLLLLSAGAGGLLGSKEVAKRYGEKLHRQLPTAEEP